MLEEIEQGLIEGESKKSTTKETEALIESLLKDSKPSSTKHGHHQRSHSRTPKGLVNNHFLLSVNLHLDWNPWRFNL